MTNKNFLAALCPIVFLSFITLVPATADAAPIDFVEQPLIAGPGVSSAQSFMAIDIDNDGDLEIVSGSSISGEVYLLDNLGGTFSAPRIIAETPSPRALAQADLDNDGLLDILVTETTDDLVLVLFNQGGGTFSTPVVISNIGDQQPDVDAADFDNDGDIDVVYISFADDALRYIENLGSRNFAAPVDIATNVDGPQGIDIGDINGDGNIDILVASSFDDVLGWFGGNGDGSFAPRQIVSTSTGSPRGARLADLDGDGDLDAFTFPGNGSSVSYYLNAGTGSFGAEQLVSFAQPNQIVQIDLGDYDGDGDLDVAYVNSVNNADDEIGYLVNLGNAVLGVPTTIAGPLKTGFRFITADFVGSGLPDAVYLEDTVHIDLSENQSGVFQSPTRLTLAIPNLTALSVSDAENDGDDDLFALSSTDDTLYYIENNAGSFNPLTVIDDNLSFPTDIVAVDLDGDGDVDPAITESFTDSVSFFEQTAPGVFATRVQITSQADVASDIAAGDIDGDGDIDLVSLSVNDDRVAWYPNLGTASLGFGQQQVISTNGDSPRDVTVADIDGDGQQDVLVVSATDSELNVYRNTGAGTFSTNSLVASNLTQPQVVKAGDINGDGRPDVVIGTATSIEWFRNTSQSGQISLVRETALPAPNTQFPVYADLRLRDLDDDDDLDVVATSLNSSQFLWFENDGAGVFFPAQLIASSRSSQIDTADVDGDGLLDVITSNQTNSTVAWQRNTMQRDFGDAPDPAYPTLRATDGARHEVSLLFLGSVLDAEPDGQPQASADGDDTDAATNDEEGVTFDGLVQDGAGTLDISVSQANTGFINAFIDFNNDGDFDDSGEHAVMSELIEGTTESILFGVPPSTPTGDRIARVRLSSVGSEGETPTGQANDGEVEDYLITIGQATLSVGNATITEADSNTTLIEFPITLSDALQTSLAYTLAVTPGDTDNDDLIAPTTAFVLSPQTTSAVAGIAINGDTDFELDETFTVTLASTGNVLIGTQTATGTILNNDTAPSVSLSSSVPSIAENGGTTIVTATLSNRSYQPVTVTIDFSGDANNGSDYSVNTNQVTIPAGQLAADVTVTAIDDTTIEGNETISASVDSVTNGSIGTNAVVDVLIIDDEIPSASISTAASTIDENGGTTTVTATLSFATAQTVTLDLGFTGSANGSDYNPSATQLVFPANVTTASFNVTSIDDAIFEGTETLSVSIINATNASTGNPALVDIDITDDDSQPTVSLMSAATSFGEAGDSFDLTASLSNPSTQPVVIDLALGGNANAGTDYTPATAQLTIPANSTSTLLTLVAQDDATFEGNETIVIDIANATNATVSSMSTLSIDLIDDDSEPTVELTQSGASFDEAGGTATLSAVLSNPTTQTVSLPLLFTGDASSNDYAASATQITINPGLLDNAVTLTSVDDNLFEGDETLVATIGVISNATAGTTISQSLLILDDESIPTASLQLGTPSATEGGSNTLTIVLSNPTTQTVTLNMSISGTAANDDFSIAATSVSIAPGDTTAVVPITIAEDSIFEGNENVVISIDTIANATSGSPASVSFDIVENDAPPVVSIAAMPAVIIENGGMTNVVATLSNLSVQDVTVTVGFAGTSGPSDYVAAGTEIVIPAGSLNNSLMLTATDDSVFEGDETIVASVNSVANGSAGSGSATISITDDETVPVVTLSTINSTLDEPGGTVIISATLSNASTQPVSVDIGFAGTAGNADYSASNTTLLIAAGTTSADLMLTGIDDALIEGGETVVLSIANTTNAVAGDGVSVTIVDDEAPEVSLSLSETTIDENSGTVTLTASLSFASPDAISISIGTAGSASSGDYSISGTTIDIAAGDLEGALTVTTINDGDFEGDETVEFTVASAVNASAATSAAVTLTILDDELPPPPALTLTSSLNTIPENGGVSEITATIGTVFPRDVVVPLRVRGGVTDTDYALAANIVIPARTFSASVTLTALDDIIDEADESIVIYPGGVANTELGAMNSVEIRIIDDELTNSGAPVVDTSTPLVDQTVSGAYQRIPIATFGLRNSGTENATVRRVNLGIALTELKSTDFGTVLIYEDLNGNGIVEPGEPLVANASLIDLGTSVDFPIETPITLGVGETRRYVALATR